jgi:hypothetical protein
MKAVSTAIVSACGVERRRAIGSDAMKGDHHVGNRNHSVRSGPHDLSGYELRACRNPVTVGRSGIEFLRMRETGAEESKKKNRKARC